ncbi:MAG: FtsX-like permease family protein [Vicinamibacterales bacterium]|nr:FtsX-like permease family protein [Vicinamibacterales bacterium]
MRFVLAMAGREMRASFRRLLFFFICIAVGVGAIVALRSVVQNVRAVLTQEARSMLGADALISGNAPATEAMAAQIDARLAEFGAERLHLVEVATMVRPAEGAGARTRMVELKAVEPGFPFYGEIVLDGGLPFDHALLRDFGVVVRPELLAQLGLAVGDGLLIGTERFEIRGVVLLEPGRQMGGGFSLGPRVFADLDNLRATGLLTFGSRADYDQLIRVDDARLEPLVAALREDTAGGFLRVRSHKNTENNIGRNLERAENYLSLVGLVIVILGGIGVSSVVRVFVQQKIRSIAILKCLGGSSWQLLSIYLLQVIVLGLAGSLLGVALASVAIAAVPPALAAAATPGVEVAYGVTPGAAAQGLGIGLAVALLFSLVPLLEVRKVKPSLLLRDEAGPGGFDPLRWAAIAAVASMLIALTVWQAGSWRIGLVVATGFAAAALVLNLAGWVLIRAIAPLSRTRWFALRHAVLQLSRPGSQARVVLLAVGLGSFFIVGVRSLQETLIAEFNGGLTLNGPDMVLLDVQSDQAAGVRAFLNQWRPADATEPVRLVPVLRARVTGVDGRTVSMDSYEEVRARRGPSREYTVTFRGALEENESVLAGAFWADTPSSEAEVSIEENIRRDYGIDVGDRMRFDVLGRTVDARVTSVRRVNWSDGRAGGFMFVFRPGVLESAPHWYFAPFRGPDDVTARGTLQGELVAQYPNVSVIDVREILQAARVLVDNITLAVTVVGTLVLFSGLLILIGAVAMTKFRRVYEAAIFKTLGATRQTIASILLLEYGVLGALAGTIGSVGAIGLTWGISRFALDIPWRPLPLLSLSGIVIASVLVAAVGVIASWEVLQRKPLATLRAE